MSGNKIKNIAILGSTEPVGMQALRVVEAYPERFQVEVLTAHSGSDLLAEQAIKFQVNAVVLHDESSYNDLKDMLFDHGIKVFCGSKAETEIVEMASIDIVIIGLKGLSVLKPAMQAIEAGKTIALESGGILVAAGDLITKRARLKGVNIYPLGSSHSAIFQCLAGEFHNKVEKIYLTSDGGPLRGKKAEELQDIHPTQILKNCSGNVPIEMMINAGTMMSDGLKLIEAKWLFGIKPDQVEIMVHPESILQSMVQFEDGSMKSLMGLPQKELPVQYAMNYPERLKTDFPRFDFMESQKLSFEKYDADIFKMPGIANRAILKGGNSPCVLKAAVEVATKAFIEERISFLNMAELVEDCIENISHISTPSIEDYFETDSETRKYAESILPELAQRHYTNKL